MIYLGTGAQNKYFLEVKKNEVLFRTVRQNF